jgi:serine/threonine protein kinase
VIAYILLSGRPPYKGRTKQDIFKSILTNELAFDNPIWTKVTPEGKAFIKWTLEKDYHKRPSAS